MLPKQFVLPKKGFGSSLASPRHQGSLGMTRSYSSVKSIDKLQKSPLLPKEKRTEDAMQKFYQVQETFQKDKTEIINELNTSQKVILQHVQTLVSKFVGNMQKDYRLNMENMRNQVSLLKSQIKEKDTASQGLVEENHLLSQKNEALSKLISNGLNQINETNSLLESSNMSFQVESQNTQQDHIDPVVQGTRNVDKNDNKTQPVITIQEAETIVPPKEIDILVNAIETITEELYVSRRIAIEENSKYIIASKSLEEALKERQELLEIKENYEKLISENNQAVNNLQDFGFIQQYKKQNSELEENYRKSVELLEQNIQVLRQEKDQLSEQLQSTRTEFETIVKEYKRRVEKTTSSLEEKELNQALPSERKLENLFAYFDIVKSEERILELKEEPRTQDIEKESMKQELEAVKIELEEYKAKLFEKLQVHEENYSAHLDIINELHMKIETVIEECEHLHKIESNNNEPYKSPARERNSVSRDSVEDLFSKLEGLEKTLHGYVEERKQLLDENAQLLVKLKEAQDKNSIENKNQNDENESQPDQACNQVTQEKDLLLVQVEQYKEQIMNLDKEISELNSQNASLKANSEENVLLLTQIRKEKDEIQQKLTDLQTREQILNDEIKSLQDKIEESKKCEQDTVDKGTVEKNAQDHEVQIEILQLKLEDALEDCSEYKTMKEDLEQQLKHKNDEIIYLEKALESNKRELDLKGEGYRKLMEEFKEGKQSYGSAEDEMFEKYQQLQEICDRFELKCEKLTQQKEALQRELDIVMEENTRLREASE